MTRRVIILGSTGSIGTQTLEVLSHLNALHARGEWGTKYSVVGLAAGRNAELAAAQAKAWGCPPSRIAVADADGPAAAEALVRETPSDLVVSAMVGESGLPATLAAVEKGVDVALANKETLVAAGSLIVPMAARSGARLLPVDSEHSAIWQCITGLTVGGAGAAPPMTLDARVARVILTASGGPFRTRTLAQVRHASPEEALKHPNWAMGKKVTIDSATMMNKALELIEAHHLFGLPESRLGVFIHPQSIVHSFVELNDGSVLAQLGTPDMRGPIQCAVAWPGRASASARRLTLADFARLEFAPADEARWEAIALARRVINESGISGAAFNAANEEAVEAFLAGRLAFGAITGVAGHVLDAIGPREATTLGDIAAASAEARRAARAFIERAGAVGAGGSGGRDGR